MRLLILKSLMHRKLQNLALIASIAVGVAIVFSVAAIYKGVASGMDLSRQRMGADIVVVPSDVAIEPSLLLFGGAPVNIYMPKSIIDSVRTVPGVSRVTPQFFAHTMAGTGCCDIDTETRLIGYDPATDWIIAPWLRNTQKSELSSDDIILGAKVENWGEKKINILGKTFDIAAIAEETGTSLDYSLLISLEEAQRLVGNSFWLKAVWEKYGLPNGLISAILVQVDESADINEIVARIQQIGTVQVIVAADVKKKISDQFAVLVQLLGGLGLMTVAVSFFQLFTRFYSLTWERQAEWGLYLALGASRCDIAAAIVGEAIAVSLAGALTGLMLGGVMYQTVLEVLTSYLSFPFIAPTWQYIAQMVLFITVVCSAFGGIAAWLPAHFGSHTDPSTIMIRGEFD